MPIMRLFASTKKKPKADDLLLRETAFPVFIPNDHVSMSPSSGEVAQTPEPKSTSGLASVFKSLTGSKSSRTPNAQSQATISTKLQASAIAPALAHDGPPDFEHFHQQLKAGNPLADRVSAAEALRYAVQDYPLDGVTSIFRAGKDLIEPTKPLEARIAGFELLTACVKNEASTDPERLAYFRVITEPANPEDFHLQLAALVELARHGRDLSGFHYDTIPLLTDWLGTIFSVTTAARKQAGRQHRTQKSKAPIGEETNLSLLFAFIVDVIKFSFSVANEETTGDLIDVILHICVNTPLSSDLRACISVVEAIVTYGSIPSNKLADCVKVICSIHCLVNDVQSEAWRTISNLCKSHNGQVTVRILLDILREPPFDAANEKQAIREIRGALSTLEKLFAKDGRKGYPLVPYTLLMEALTNVVAVEHPKIEHDVLRVILSLFKDDDRGMQGVMANVIEEDWSVMFQVILKCSQRVLETSDDRQLSSRPRLTSPLAPLAKEELVQQNLTANLTQTLHSLILRIAELIDRFSGIDFFQKEDCIKFFIVVHSQLPQTCSMMVIDHYIEYRYCYPSDQHWKDNIVELLKAFYVDRMQPTYVRLHALRAVIDVFDVMEMIDEYEDSKYIETFAVGILHCIGEEQDITVLQTIVNFAVHMAETADDLLFHYVVDAIRGSINSDRLQSPLSSPPGTRPGLMTSHRSNSSSQTPTALTQTPSNVVTKGLIHIFMRTMDKSSSKPKRIFEEVLSIAKSVDCETDARISAMKMLFRLRADWENGIFLTAFTESDGLAASLYRTPASLARKQAADEVAQSQRLSRAEEAGTTRLSRSTSFSQGHPQSRQSFRSGSGINRALLRNHQMWMCPDADALPEPASGRSSSLLKSVAQMTTETSHAMEDEGNHEGEEAADEAHPSDADENTNPALATLEVQTALDIPVYLETVISLMQNGCDWEVYSYILVHLPSQLTNQALFKAAIQQIKSLRGLLCDQIKKDSFQEPPVSSGLRKADVSICLFQILNMVTSYHKYFSKSDQDEIVQTFIRGVGERTSKSCIHALSICCHELPGSTSKALVTILAKMSQIITQSHVAVHILEFLACLARLPNLYVNFREDEYRIVFAICFRYLQYVRDQRAKENPSRNNTATGRNSVAPADGPRLLGDAGESNFQPNTSDELPQYVYALAYHVIIFWFLSLRLEDRPGQVSWIAKNLISTDANGKESIDEQAQVTLDFMQRVAYADVDESAPDPTFTDERFGKINKHRWIIGNSLVTIEQASRGGWGQITKRQPSGTSCYVIREKFNRPPPHQVLPPTDATQDGRNPNGDENSVLPSHLLLQIAASIPQTADTVRPLPLPNEEFMERFVRSFDRIFTVDSHKVGVVYIGENQTEEVEILTNVMGSSDYTEFLSGLGTLTPLKGAKFNTQGLDRQTNTDGEYAFCWRDRVTEIVFHVTTQMPTNLEQDPQCIGKKRHIGNDFVNIIFNNSGHPFGFDTFPSQFNYVNIVITPESRESFTATRLRPNDHANNAFYKVQVMSKPGFPEISPAAETKIMSLSALPNYIRLLALNASVFSLVWDNREGGEHISSWRARLREINRVRDKYSQKQPSSTPTSPPGTANGAIQDGKSVRDSLNSLRRSSVANFLTSNNESNSQRSSVLSTAETEVGIPIGEANLVDSLDFSRWAAYKG